MFYAIHHRYGRHIQNADRVYAFTRRELRDAWVDANEQHRSTASARDSIVRTTRRDHVDGDVEGWEVIARRRVASHPQLDEYRYELVHYDWGNPEHWQWVATASIRELRVWAKAMKKDAVI